MEYSKELLIVAAVIIVILICAVVYLAISLIDEVTRKPFELPIEEKQRRPEAVRVERIQTFLKYCDICAEQLAEIQADPTNKINKLEAVEKQKQYLITQSNEYITAIQLQCSFLYLIPVIEETAAQNIAACDATIKILKEVHNVRT